MFPHREQSTSVRPKKRDVMDWNESEIPSRLPSLRKRQVVIDVDVDDLFDGDVRTKMRDLDGQVFRLNYQVRNLEKKIDRISDYLEQLTEREKVRAEEQAISDRRLEIAMSRARSKDVDFYLRQGVAVLVLAALFLSLSAFDMFALMAGAQ